MHDPPSFFEGRGDNSHIRRAATMMMGFISSFNNAIPDWFSGKMPKIVE
jgi:hypothetical protein